MLNVDLSIRDGDGLGVVALRGEFKLVDVPGVASHLITAVAVCGSSVIVDLAALEGIGYSGLAVLLRIRKWTRAGGGDLPLAAPQPPVRRVLEATGLDRCLLGVSRRGRGRGRGETASVPAVKRASAALCHHGAPMAASGGRYAALRITRWPGRCADTERASRGASRVIFVSIGVRPEEERRPDRLWLISWFSRRPAFAISVMFANARLRIYLPATVTLSSSCAERLDVSDAAAVVAAFVLIVARQPEIIVDLAGLEFIDSSGVAALARGRKLARHAGGDLLLASP